MKDQAYAGQVVLVTGGSRGIGYSTAAAFLAQGARVAICSKNEERLRNALQTLSPAGEVAGWTTDVADHRQVETLVERTLERFGRIDVLINNAARLFVGDFAAEDIASIDEIVDVNLKGPMYACHAVLPPMLESGAGCIINISSSLGTYGMPRVATYCATKFGLVGFTESLAQEVKAAGISVYSVTLGMAATDMQEQFSGRKQGMPPEIVAEEILLLAGPNPPIKTGASLDVYL